MKSDQADSILSTQDCVPYSCVGPQQHTYAGALIFQTIFCETEQMALEFNQTSIQLIDNKHQSWYVITSRKCSFLEISKMTKNL